jgi:hypothetical protein
MLVIQVLPFALCYVYIQFQFKAEHTYDTALESDERINSIVEELRQWKEQHKRYVLSAVVLCLCHQLLGATIGVENSALQHIFLCRSACHKIVNVDIKI